jgi:hypothetical protein
VLNFEQTRLFLNNFKNTQIDDRLGMFYVKIKTNWVYHQFSNLKHYSDSENIINFYLTNYAWFDLDKTFAKKKNIYFDGENVEIEIKNNGYIQTQKFEKSLIIQTRNFDVYVGW